jgi:hypothetical protein
MNSNVTLAKKGKSADGKSNESSLLENEIPYAKLYTAEQ